MCLSSQACLCVQAKVGTLMAQLQRTTAELEKTQAAAAGLLDDMGALEHELQCAKGEAVQSGHVKVWLELSRSAA